MIANMTATITVSLSRLRSATVDPPRFPSGPMPPPKASASPPPLPACSRISEMSPRDIARCSATRMAAIKTKTFHAADHIGRAGRRRSMGDGSALGKFRPHVEYSYAHGVIGALVGVVETDA